MCCLMAGFIYGRTSIVSALAGNVARVRIGFRKAPYISWDGSIPNGKHVYDDNGVRGVGACRGHRPLDAKRIDPRRFIRAHDS